MQAWTVSAPGTLTFSPACNSHTARHNRVCRNSERLGGSVQLSNELELSTEAVNDTNKFAMEVLFRTVEPWLPCPGRLFSITAGGKFYYAMKLCRGKENENFVDKI